MCMYACIHECAKYTFSAKHDENCDDNVCMHTYIHTGIPVHEHHRLEKVAISGSCSWVDTHTRTVKHIPVYSFLIWHGHFGLMQLSWHLYTHNVKAHVFILDLTWPFQPQAGQGVCASISIHTHRHCEAHTLNTYLRPLFQPHADQRVYVCIHLHTYTHCEAHKPITDSPQPFQPHAAQSFSWTYGQNLPRPVV